MARGVRSSPAFAAPALPKVSFEKIEDEVSTQPGGVHDAQARSYGYNDFSEFQRPDHYIRYIEPLESDLARQVEYDMDEQDKEWLDAVNADRKKEQLNKASYEVFEIIMDRLEKEWFDLTKNIPKPDLAMPSEDSTCAICDDSEGENSNAIVFCDGCNLAVHQDCYGVPYIPEGQWLCRKCTVSPEIPVSCILCPNEGGAFKQTVHGEWVHLLCAIWVPETRVANDVFMEPVTGVDKISKQRWKLKCNICDIREGACIQCAKTSCFLAFHTTCARKERLLLAMKSTQGSEPVSLTCYCERHLPKEQQDAREAALAADRTSPFPSPSRSARPQNTPTKNSKSARAYAKTYTPGPPLVPAVIVTRILQYIGKVSLRKKPEFVAMVCRYWSLKREARRGAPLLKRLHLEPWSSGKGTGGTGLNGERVISTEERQAKLEMLKLLKADLERVKELTRLTRKRETEKLNQATIIQGILSQCLFPHEAPLRYAFEKIMSIDKKEYFKNPVSKVDVPDYFDIIKEPMCWTIIDGKLDRHEYWDVQAFKDDIDLVINNAVLYNKPGTTFQKAALRIREGSKPFLDGIDRLSFPHAVVETSTEAPEDDPMADHTVDFDAKARPVVGDLEPPLEILDLLVSTDAIKDDIDLVLNQDPIASLLNYELGVPKPLPPPPPRKPPKPKRDRQKEQEKRRQTNKARAEAAAAAAAAQEEHERLLQQALDESAGFRAPRTRRAVAAAAQFESETLPDATGTSVVDGPPEASSSTATGWESLNNESKRPPSKRRGTGTAPGQTEIPPMVEDVDNRGSFTMFEKGWILPPDQKRGGRTPVERAAVPPPRKRAKTDREVSRLSVISTAASENQMMQTSPPSARQIPTSAGISDDADTSMSQPLAALTITTPPVSAVRQTFIQIPPGNIVKRPDGTIIIEQLDTPAIRKQKTLFRKAARMRLAAESAASEAAAAAAPALAESSFEPPIAGPSRLPPAVIEPDDSESDLSSLSDLDDEDADENPVSATVSAQAPAPRSKTAKVRSPELNRGEIILPKGKRLPDGTLVWARARSYPWWPAVVHDISNPSVPINIKEEYKQVAARHKGSTLHIVQFYDTHQSWQYPLLKDMKMLGEDTALDEDMIAPVPSPHLHKWKNVHERNLCREAFRRAMADMVPGDVSEDEAGEGVNEEAAIPNAD